MIAKLEGGCQVMELREGAPEVSHGLRCWPLVGPSSGARAISLRAYECDPGRAEAIVNVEADEVFYVLAGHGRAWIDGEACVLEADSGLYLASGRELVLENTDRVPLVLVSSRCPAGDGSAHVQAKRTRIPWARLRDQSVQTTADRWYCTLVAAAQGSQQVTQFVGSIPPGRAPDHYHQYEEVLCILRGTGRMWAGESSAPLVPGRCVFLPRGQVHCVENTGTGELRLLGLFYPSGSPAVRYDA